MDDGIKIDTNVEINWYALGQSLARKSSPDQAALLDGFSAGVHALGSIEAYSQIDYIAREVHGYTAWFVEEMNKQLAERQTETTPKERVVGEVSRDDLHVYSGNRSQDTCWVGAPNICGKPIEDSIHIEPEDSNTNTECAHETSVVKFDGGNKSVVCDSCGRILTRLSISRPVPTSLTTEWGIMHHSSPNETTVITTSEVDARHWVIHTPRDTVMKRQASKWVADLETL